MENTKNLLTITLVVMAAGSSIYTFKTFMKPGVDLNINLEGITPSALIDGNETLTTTTTTTETITLTTTPDSLTLNFPPTTDMPNVTLAMNETMLLDEGLGPKKRSTNEDIVAIRKEMLNNVQVSTSLGKFKGAKLSVLGRQVCTFFGVPFAQPPVGRLRFKKPQAIESSWNGTKVVTEFGNACLQPRANRNDTNRERIGEDCLNLNIWLPCNSNSTEVYPVLFFIHGGSFARGSNALDVIDGRALASLENIIVVTVNYRLGPLGFLSFGHKEIETNLGLYDLAEALRWTMENVKYFGGDPTAITVAGHGSGAIGASFLLTSPQTRHLVHRSILQSGSSTVFNFYYQQSQKCSDDFLATLGCLKSGSDLGPNVSSNREHVWKCLQNATSEELLAAAERQASKDAVGCAYSPKIGDDFLPQGPKELLDQLRQVDSVNRSLLLGINANEEAFFFNMGYPQLFTKKSPTLKDLEEVRQFLSASLKDWGISRRTLRLINSFFLEKSNTLEPRSVLRAMQDIFGDLTFTCPVWHFAERFALASSSSGNTSGRSKIDKQSAYFYYFNHTQSMSNGTGSDELVYTFGHPLRFPDRYTGAEIDLSKRTMSVWASFTRTGIPSSAHLPATLGWPRFTPDLPVFVELNDREFGVVNSTNTATTSSSNNNNNNIKRYFNCDTWKHAFKIFTL